MGLASCVLNISCSKECDPDEVVLLTKSFIKEMSKDSKMVYVYHRFGSRQFDTIETELSTDDTVFLKTTLPGDACDKYREAHTISFYNFYLRMSFFQIAGNDSKSNYLAMDLEVHDHYPMLKATPYTATLSQKGTQFQLDSSTQARIRGDSGLVWVKNTYYELKRIK